jgi:hypothetical protein
VNAGHFDVCILASSRKPFLYRNGIHVWIKSADFNNANLMILLSFIILGHPDWIKGNIKIFEFCKPGEVEETRKRMKELVKSGRLPITAKNIEIIVEKEEVSPKSIINTYSADAGLTIIGFREEIINHEKEKLFEGYTEPGNILFVNSHNQKEIE